MSLLVMIFTIWLTDFERVIMGGRGSCRRKRSLRCSRCYSENISNYILGLGGIVWENVDAVKRVGNYYFCRCRNCGHEYKTNSLAARRDYRFNNND